MSLRNRLIRNIHELTLEETTRTTPAYAGGRGARVLGPRVPGTAARKLGATYDEVPPGKVSCPFHLHHAQEELFVILEGEGTLRVADERIPIRAGDVIGIPPGPAYPHQIVNTGGAPLKYLSISTQEQPEVCEYPDSGKYLAMSADGGPLLGRGRLHRPDSAVDYWDGEA